MILKLVKNNGYKWIRKENVCFKGYFTLMSEPEKVLRGDEAAGFFQNINSMEQFLECLKGIEGVYSIIIDKEDKTFAATDRARALPVYFSSDGKYLSDSAEEVRKLLGEDAKVDADNYLSLFSVNYLTVNNTVYENIRQLDMGQACEISKDGIKIERYFCHISPVVEKTEDELISELNHIAKNVFTRIKAAIGGRPVVLSMSGGYDSRFVGCMLKKAGIEDVSCYTYGKLSSFEVMQSKKNAQALGYRWTCVEYTDEDVRGVLDEVGLDYIKTNNNHDFTAYIQNFPAVRKLHEQGWFKPGSVFITGLCGDMPTGSYVPPYIPDMVYDTHAAAEKLFSMMFTRYKVDEKFKEKWMNETKKQLEELPVSIKDYQSYVSAVDAIYTGTCHSRLFMHMNDVHDYFGYEWLLPFWDSELLMKWYSIPARMRVRQALYEKWLLHDICDEYGIGQKKTLASYSKKKIIKKMQHFAGSIISFALLHLNIPFRRPYDINNFAPLELELFKKLKKRKWVSYRKAGLALLQNQYVLQQRYDVKYMAAAAKRVKKK